MSKSVVSVAQGFDAGPAVHKAVELLGGISSFINKGSTVVVKPNAGHEGAPETAINTSPEMVKAVIEEVKRAGPGRIILAESSAIGCDTMTCLEVSGIKKAAEEAGVDEIRDIKSETDLVEKTIENPTSAITSVQLPKFLLEADHIINVPIFKSHVSMVFTCALKNLKGVVQDMHHFVMHTTNLAAAMMDLGAVFKPDLTIADLIRPMEGFGPHSGTPAEMGVVLAGSDMVAVDATACRLTGLDINQVDYFEAAANKGLGRFHEDEIELRGASLAEAGRALYLPYLKGFEAWPEYHFHLGMACSTCQGLAAFTMERLKALGEYEKNQGLHLVLGRKPPVPAVISPEDEFLLFGDCTVPFRKRIEKAGGKCLQVGGCPPLEPFPYWTIMDREEQPTEKATRERHSEEELIFKEWLSKQKR